MNNPDFTLAWEGDAAPPFEQLQIVAFQGSDAMSSLYRYELTLAALSPSPLVEPDTLAGTLAALRMYTHSEPSLRIVHGRITEVRELSALPQGMLYQAVMLSPFAQMNGQKQRRVFVNNTLRDIIHSVFAAYPDIEAIAADRPLPSPSNESAFAPPKLRYAYRLGPQTNIDHPSAYLRCRQWDESDWSFLLRLLAQEGISTHIEQNESTVLLVFSNSDSGRPRLGPSAPGREIRAVRVGARIGGDTALRPAWGEGSCRLLSAGTIFSIDGLNARYSGEYLATNVLVRGERPELKAMLPDPSIIPWRGEAFQVEFEALRRGKAGKPDESNYRPAPPPLPFTAPQESIGTHREEFTGLHRTALIGGHNNELIAGNESRNLGGHQSLSIGSHQSIDIGGRQSIRVSGASEQSSAQSQTFEAPAQRFAAEGEQRFEAQDCSIQASKAKLISGRLDISATGEVHLESAQLEIKGGPVIISGGDITITGGKVMLGAGEVSMQGMKVEVTGGLIKLN